MTTRLMVSVFCLWATLACGGLDIPEFPHEDMSYEQAVTAFQRAKALVALSEETQKTYKGINPEGRLFLLRMEMACRGIADALEKVSEGKKPSDEVLEDLLCAGLKDISKYTVKPLGLYTQFTRDIYQGIYKDLVEWMKKAKAGA